MKKAITTALVAILATAAASSVRAADPLASWNEGQAKKSVVAFVAKVTTPGSPDFVPPAERIATFENDGCLWPSSRCTSRPSSSSTA